MAESSISGKIQRARDSGRPDVLGDGRIVNLGAYQHDADTARAAVLRGMDSERAEIRRERGEYPE